METDAQSPPFYLTFWGSFQCDGLATKLLGTEVRDFWFETANERGQFRERVEGLADEHGRTVVFSESNGPLSLKRTVAVMVLRHEGRDYDLEYDFGFGYPPEDAYFMFHEGNYSCDCNRSIFLHERYSEVPELEACGDTINMMRFDIEYRDAESEEE